MVRFMEPGKITKKDLRFWAIIIGIFFTIFLICDSITTAQIPPTIKGRYSVFEAEMGFTSKISQIDTTEEYIYLAYYVDDVVAVYDWDGNHVCSMAFCHAQKGGLNIRCENGFLYVMDGLHYQYMIEGTELVEMRTPSKPADYYTAYLEDRECGVVVKRGELYDAETGRFIMKLPGHL